MGMYTEFKFHAELHKLSTQDIDTLKHLVSRYDEEVTMPEDGYPDHPVFSKRRLSFLFWGEMHEVPIFKIINGKWVLSLYIELKNYESEIETFIDWIKPYIRKGLIANTIFVNIFAKTRYEEDEDWTIHELI